MDKEKQAVLIIDEAKSDNQRFVNTPEEKAFVRKLNWKVLPLIFFIIMIQFCDKSALSVAAVLGIFDDTHITEDQFSWVGSIFYLGYLICQPLNNYFIQRLPIARYFGSVLVLWGIVMTMTSFCHDFSQLAACRFLLGFFEGVSYPCVYILLNTLYRRSEQSFCWGFIGIGTGMGTVIGVVIAYGIAHMEGVAGMHAWRWGYIVFGIATVVIGVITFFFLIDDTHHRLLHLSEIELEIVEERTRDNCVVRNTTIKKEQMWEALREPRLYLLFFANMLICLENGGLVTYSTLLVEGLGFSKFTSVILQIPNGVAAAVFAMGAVVIAKWRQQNIITAIAMSLTSMIGCILIIVIPGTAKLVGFYLTWAMTGVMALLQTIVSNNVSGYTKRVFYNGVSMVGMTIGNFAGPLAMMGNQGPQKTGALIGYAVANIVLIFCLAIIYMLMKRENEDRIRCPAEAKVDVYLDLTDRQDRNILYKL
ncbi:hypothetical protein RMATCC62417_08735 [Rhizopus microsporus]|nr:hypothetical protein RMATCC62417_08735 [Rhizopus microsporus]